MFKDKPPVDLEKTKKIWRQYKKNESKEPRKAVPPQVLLSFKKQLI